MLCSSCYLVFLLLASALRGTCLSAGHCISMASWCSVRGKGLIHGHWLPDWMMSKYTPLFCYLLQMLLITLWLRWWERTRRVCELEACICVPGLLSNKLFATSYWCISENVARTCHLSVLASAESSFFYNNTGHILQSCLNEWTNWAPHTLDFRKHCLD